jgi:hypothetical protein
MAGDVQYWWGPACRVAGGGFFAKNGCRDWVFGCAQVTGTVIREASDFPLRHAKQVASSSGSPSQALQRQRSVMATVSILAALFLLVALATAFASASAKTPGQPPVRCRADCRFAHLFRRALNLRNRMACRALAGTFARIKQHLRMRRSMYNGVREMHSIHARAGPCRDWRCRECSLSSGVFR